MCDYSLHHVASRPAKVSDKLVTTELARSSTRGFAAVGEHGAKLVIHDGPPKVAVCLLPGTELAFDDDDNLKDETLAAALRAAMRRLVELAGMMD